jgi:hypothetical protein
MDNTINNGNSSLKIGLLDNACHSLMRGYEMWGKGRDKKDALSLKEAIIWIHHGIELSLKQLLVQSNEYLVFDKVDEAVRKLAHLRRQVGMEQATVFDLFDNGEGAYTVGFANLVERAAIMLNLKSLEKNSLLRNKIDALTAYRNKIVHFAVEVNINEVTSLLADLMEPFLELLEQEIRDEKFVSRCLPYVRASAKSVTAVFKLKADEAEERIIQLLQKFNGQQVEGELFGVDGTLILPVFQKVVKNAGAEPYFDISAEGESIRWLIDIKFSTPNLDQLRRLQQQYQKQVGSQPWLIFMGTSKAPNRRSFDKVDVLSSSEFDIKKLEKILS